jgi:hypothetical protein
MEDHLNNKWHLDKRVPITLIVTMLMQTITIVWWASRLNARVEVLEYRTNEQFNELRVDRESNIQQNTQIVLLQSQLNQILTSQNELKSDLKELTSLLKKEK